MIDRVTNRPWATVILDFLSTIYRDLRGAAVSHFAVTRACVQTPAARAPVCLQRSLFVGSNVGESLVSHDTAPVGFTSKSMHCYFAPAFVHAAITAACFSLVNARN